MSPSKLTDYEMHAQSVLTSMAYHYYAGGARDEITLSANRRAWDDIWLHYRVLVDVSNRETTCEILGREVRHPILIAPSAFHGLAHPDGECETARGAESNGGIFIVSTLSNRSIEEVSAVTSGPLWFQLYIYKDRSVTLELVRRAERAKYQAIVLTVDASEIGTRERDQASRFHLPNPLTMANLIGTGMEKMDPTSGGSSLATYVREQLDPSLTWSDLSWLVEQTRLPVIVKGIVRADDAKKAVALGAQGVVVSNHGGRQLDTAPPTAVVLPTIAHAIGDSALVLVDGGIRRGTDIVKAIALGAHGVLVGRPILWGLATEGARGVHNVMSILQDELLEAMALCGCPDISSIDHQLIHPPQI